MNCENIETIISAYLDNELPGREEGFLFTHLANCGECREEFKIQSRIQHEVKLHQKDVSQNFETRIFNSVRVRKNTFAQRWITKPTPIYINYFLGIIILAIMLFSFVQVASLRQDLNIFQARYEASLKQMNYQASQMFLLMNSMPAVEIKQY